MSPDRESFLGSIQPPIFDKSSKMLRSPWTEQNVILQMTVRTLVLLSIFKLCQSTANLTYYVAENKLKEGREAARVTNFAKKFDKLESYAGFFEVNKTFDSYMFFWYFPPIAKNFGKFPETPLIVWLEGGVGMSSMINALRGNGPIRLSSNGRLSYNKFNWAARAHLVYFDNPVGAGYSLSKKQGFPTNQKEVANDLYAQLKQFVTLFELTKNPLYLTGSGYAGKYITSLGVLIDEQNQKNGSNMNLQGIAIENGFIDPPNMLAYGKYLYQLGMIDEKGRDEFHKMRNQIIQLLKESKYQKAQHYWTRWMVGSHSKFHKYTGLPGLHDVTQVKKGEDEDKMLTDFLNQESTHIALNTEKIKFVWQNARVKKSLEREFFKSQAADLLFLMNRYRVLLYYGQMNIMEGYTMMTEALKKYKWIGYDSFWHKKRNNWYVDGELAGYARKGSRLTVMLIRNVGSRISTHQPKWALRMIETFIYFRSMKDH